MSDFTIRLIETVKGTDTGYLEELDRLAIDIVPNILNHNNLAEHASPIAFSYILGADNLYPTFHKESADPNASSRLTLLKHILMHNRVDLIGIFLAKGGAKKLTPCELSNLVRHESLRCFPRYDSDLDRDITCSPDTLKKRAIMAKLIDALLPPSEEILNSGKVKLLLSLAFWSAGVETVVRAVKESRFPVADIKLGTADSDFTVPFNAIPTMSEKVNLLKALLEAGVVDLDKPGNVKLYMADRPPGVDRIYYRDPTIRYGYDC